MDLLPFALVSAQRATRQQFDGPSDADHAGRGRGSRRRARNAPAAFALRAGLAAALYRIARAADPRHGRPAIR